MILYILFACSIYGNGWGDGASCLSANFPTKIQCENAGRNFNNHFTLRNLRVEYFCQEVKK